MCEVADGSNTLENPILDWQTGRRVEAMVIGVWHETRRSAQNTVPCFELSVKSSLLSADPGSIQAHLQKRLKASSLSHKTVYTG